MRISILVLFAILLFSSCGEYQEVLKETDSAAKYSYAEMLYNEGSYKKALKLMEQIVPVYRGKPQAEKLMFMYANTYYKLGDHYLSGYQFERFVNSYPKSDSLEYAAYLSAESYYHLSPIYSKDQTETRKGLEKLQIFIDNFPNSEYRLDANKKVSELRYKLEKKDIEVAKQYLKLGEALSTYTNAIAAFDNFISDHPGSVFRKNAFFGRFDAAYQLSLKSVPSKVHARLLIAKEYYNDFIKYYKESDLMPEAEKIMADIETKLTNTETSS